MTDLWPFTVTATTSATTATPPTTFAFLDPRYTITSASNTSLWEAAPLVTRTKAEAEAEREAAQQRAERAREARRQREAEREAAEGRAQALLRSLLPPAQQRLWTRRRKLFVRNGERRFRIDLEPGDWAPRVYECDRRGRPIASFCIHARERSGLGRDYPPSDAALTFYVMLTQDLERFLRVANRTAIALPARPARQTVADLVARDAREAIERQECEMIDGAIEDRFRAHQAARAAA